MITFVGFSKKLDITNFSLERASVSSRLQTARESLSHSLCHARVYERMNIRKMVSPTFPYIEHEAV